MMIRNFEELKPRKEYHEQCAVVDYLRAKYPDELLMVSLAGNRMSMGLRMKSKRAGMTKGVPDLFIASPKGNYYGLFIEMKRVKNSIITIPQKKWLAKAQARGYKAVVCYGAEEAYRVIDEYFEGELK